MIAAPDCKREIKQFPPLISHEPGGKFHHTLDEFFEASRSLPTRSVVTLLLSTSFGVNAVLYATWLGYLMGVWAFGIQLVWSLSFFWLAHFAGRVSRATSLHHFLEQCFGSATRRVAAACSVVGLAYFVGWEVNIAKSTLGGLTSHRTPGNLEGWFGYQGWMVAAAVALAVSASALLGRRLVATINGALNLLKSGLLAVVFIAVAVGAIVAPQTNLGHAMWPSFGEAVAAIGVTGLTTTLLFNLLWQFVDNSSWQSFSSGRAAETARDMKWSGVWVFLTVNGIGTLLGASMRGMSGVSSDNILSVVPKMTPALEGIMVAGVGVLVLASVISLVDVIILAITQAAVVDLGVLNRRVRQIRVTHARVAVVVMGVLAAWGVNAWVQWLGGNIFEFVYIMVITQLTLSGPVLLGLMARRRKPSPMWLPILLSGGIGLATAVVGSALKVELAVEAAGAITVLTSVLGSMAIWIFTATSRSDAKSV